MYRSVPDDRVVRIKLSYYARNMVIRGTNGYNSHWVTNTREHSLDFRKHPLDPRKPSNTTQGPQNTSRITNDPEGPSPKGHTKEEKERERGMFFRLSRILTERDYWLERRSTIAGTPTGRPRHARKKETRRTRQPRLKQTPCIDVDQHYSVPNIHTGTHVILKIISIIIRK